MLRNRTALRLLILRTFETEATQRFKMDIYGDGKIGNIINKLYIEYICAKYEVIYLWQTKI